MLVGNKIDRDDHEIPAEVGEEFAAKHGMYFLQVGTFVLVKRRITFVTTLISQHCLIVTAINLQACTFVCLEIYTERERETTNQKDRKTVRERQS